MWKKHFTPCPRLPEYIASFKSASVSMTVEIVKRGTGINQIFLLLSGKRFRLCWATALDIIFLTKGWALCFILAISTLTSANCIWKREGKVWAHKQVEEADFGFVIDRLKCLLAAYSEPGSAVERLFKTFLKWASASLERYKLYKFYVIWKAVEAAKKGKFFWGEFQTYRLKNRLSDKTGLSFSTLSVARCCAQSWVCLERLN